MQTQHGIAIVGILGTDVKNGMTRLDIDSGQEDSLAASLTGSLDDGIAILRKLLAIQVAMCVDVFQNRKKELGIMITCYDAEVRPYKH